jgi:arginase family enzyme
MEYRVLVDENTSPRVAESLRGKGITAKHVHEALSEGVDDNTIATFARENGSVVLTHDPDFLDPGTRSGVPVFYYSDDTMDSYEIADRVAELIKWVPDPADVPPLTNLNDWE